MTNLTMSYEDNLAVADHIIQGQRKRIRELERDLRNANERKHSLHKQWRGKYGKLEDEVTELKEHQEYLETRQEGLVDELKECYEKIGKLEAKVRALKKGAKLIEEHLLH